MYFTMGWSSFFLDLFSSPSLSFGKCLLWSPMTLLRSHWSCSIWSRDKAADELWQELAFDSKSLVDLSCRKWGETFIKQKSCNNPIPTFLSCWLRFLCVSREILVYSALPWRPFPSYRDPCDVETFYWNSEIPRLLDVVARRRKSFGHCSTSDYRLDFVYESTEGGTHVDAGIDSWTNWTATKPTEWKEQQVLDQNKISQTSNSIYSEPRHSTSRDSFFDLGCTVAWTFVLAVVTEDSGTLLPRNVVIHWYVRDVTAVWYRRHFSLRPNRIRSFDGFSIWLVATTTGFTMTPSQFQAPPLKRPRVAHGTSSK